MKRPRILKEYRNSSRWPFILEEPSNDVSFWPFDNHGCAILIFILIARLIGMFVVALILLAIVQIPSMFGIGAPVW